MIGMLYSVAIGSQSQSAAKYLIEIAAPSDAVVLIERESITQTTQDTSENLGTKTQDIATTGTGINTTARPFLGNTTFSHGATVKTNMSIPPTEGTPVWIESGFNVLSGFLWTPANDDEVIVIAPSQLAGMNLDIAPASPMDFSYMMTFREIGG